MLILHADETDGQQLSAENMSRYMGQMFAYQEALVKAGAFVATEALASSSEACIVRARCDNFEVLDGPYADAREQFGGYFIIDVANADEATIWATRCPAASWGTIEVRRIKDISEFAG